MLMSISTQVCGLILTMALLIFYYRRRQIHTLSNKMFAKLLVILLVSLICEMTFVVTTHVCINCGHYSVVSHTFDTTCNMWVQILSKLYSLSLVLFTLTVCEYDIYDIKKSSNASVILKYIVCILLCFLPIGVYVDGTFIYPEGICAAASFLVSMLVILVASIYVIKHLREVSKTKVVCMVAWLVLWILSFVLQHTYHIYLTSFACVMGVFILFYEVENPDAKVDKHTGFFMAHFMPDCFSTLKKTGLQVHIGIINSRGSEIDTNLINVKLANSYHLCFKDTDSFCYILTYDYSALYSLLTEYCSNNKSVVAIYKNFEDVDISIFTNYVRRSALSWSSSSVHIITKDAMRDLEDEDGVRLEILNALIENRIATYIQPIYNVKEGKFTSGECLCRLVRRDGKLITPDKFIPVAERTGLIVDIESTMFRNMCKCLSDERLLKSDIRYLEANLSIKKGERHDLVEEYSAILEEFNIPSNKVNLEITETDIVEQKISILNNITRMKDLGFQFSLDDFGTGESNLGYIIDMPVSIIKFDKEITQKAMCDKKAMTVVRNVIGMAHELNMKVVVEGVETEDDVRTCLAIDADYMQGYFFSRPIPVDEFIDFVNKPFILDVSLESCS